MTFTQRSVKTLNHLLLSFLGVYIIAAMFPHLTPWDMVNFKRVVIGHSLTFALKMPLLERFVFLSTSQFVLTSAAFIVLAFFTIPLHSWKKAWHSLRSHPKALFGGIIASEILLMTIVPSEPHFVSNGPAVVLYLLSSSLGLFFFLVGISPLVSLALNNDKLLSSLSSTYRFLRNAVLESPPILFVGFLMIVEFLLTNVLSYALFDHIPHIQDSIAQLFHAKIFSEGMLVAPAPPVPQFFEFTHIIINNGQWYSQYPAGHSFLLMLGLLAGAPWIINPLFAALTVSVMYLLGKELHGEIIGRLAALLTVLSPFVLFMSSEFMNHTTALFFFTVFLLFFAKGIRTGRFLHGAVAGAALGWLTNIRPYSAAALAVPFLLYGVVLFFKDVRAIKKSFLGFFLFFLLFLGILFGFNFLTNGHPFLFGFQVLWGSSVNPGFGSGAWGEAHTPIRGLHQMVSNFNGLNKYLFEWPVPSLFFVWLLFFTGKRDRWDLLFAGSFLALSFAYFFYWFQDWCFGPRFLFEAAAPLIILTSRCIYLLPNLWREVLGFSTSHRRVRGVTVGLLLILFGLGYATNIPPHLDFYGKSYWGVNTGIIKAVQEKQLQRAVIFVRSNFGSGFIGNRPLLDQDVFFVQDRFGENEKMMKAFPGYAYYRALGGTLERISMEQD